MRGDLDFERLVEEHYASLYRFALSLSGNESDAGDLVQDTFYLWATKGHQLADPTKVKSWLFTTLHRGFLGRRRHRLRFPHHEVSEVGEELPEVPPDFSGRADWSLMIECLARVGEPFQAPIALFYLEDYSYKEIAELLDVPLGTVKSRLARGITFLQRMMIERTTPDRPKGKPM